MSIWARALRRCASAACCSRQRQRCHNLRRIAWDRPDDGFDWAQRFDEASVAQLAENPGDVLKLADHPDYALAVPTPDHFIPLLYTAGLAATDGVMAPLLRGYAMGSLSMTCYGVGAESIDCTHAQGAASLPREVPPDQTNA